MFGEKGFYPKHFAGFVTKIFSSCASVTPMSLSLIHILSPDDLTAEPGDVLKGKIAGVKGSDEPAAGTLELTGNASDSQVLAGSTYYNTNPKTKRTGTMVNQGAKTAALNAGGSYTIPAGYHNGAGKVTANTLASQTGGATAEDKYCLLYTSRCV